ncbi:MAG: multicomponent Na+:H+ antiporter subunit B [Parasphingorhabdus sp.]|jgi:multicomponent Na+:H+ antiporter subunit B
MIRNPVLRITSKIMVPVIMLFALYVQFHGDFGPGGGFQAGVIFAAAIFLYAIVFGINETQRVIPTASLKPLIALGVFLYGGVGCYTLYKGGGFLNYNVLSDNPLHGQHLGIFLVELGVGITVAAVMITVFLAFAGRAR